MAEFLDLLGDPIPDNWKGRGRPAHIPTAKNRNKVSLLLARGWANERIARAIGITLPTLRKHYFSQLKQRDDMRDRLDAEIFQKLCSQAAEGNVAAVKAVLKIQERDDMMSFGAVFTKPHETKAKEPKLGKKEKALHDARLPDTGSKLGELMAQRMAGRGMPN